jgi:hypothetical protein
MTSSSRLVVRNVRDQGFRIEKECGMFLLCRMNLAMLGKGKLYTSQNLSRTLCMVHL